MRVVAALGGDALSPTGGTGSVEEMKDALGATCRHLADAVQQGFGTPAARERRRLTVVEARRLLAAGEFPEGSMGPKVEAACQFVASGGERAVTP